MMKTFCYVICKFVILAKISLIISTPLQCPAVSISIDIVATGQLAQIRIPCALTLRTIINRMGRPLSPPHVHVHFHTNNLRAPVTAAHDNK